MAERVVLDPTRPPKVTCDKTNNTEEDVAKGEFRVDIQIPMLVVDSEPRDCRSVAQRLVDEGYKQVSRKYRTVARLPPGMTGLEAMRTVDPAFVEDMMRRLNDAAAEQYLRVYAKDTVEVPIKDWPEWLRLTGRWTQQGEVIMSHTRAIDVIKSRLNSEPHVLPRADLEWRRRVTKARKVRRGLKKCRNPHRGRP